MPYNLNSTNGQKFFHKLYSFLDIVLPVLIILIIIGLLMSIGYEVIILHRDFYRNNLSTGIHKGPFIFILIVICQDVALYLKDSEIVSIIIGFALIFIIWELIFEMSDTQLKKGFVFTGILTALGTVYFFDRRLIEKNTTLLHHFISVCT